MKLKNTETGFLFPIDVVDVEISTIRKDFELAENELADDFKRLSLQILSCSIIAII